MYSWKYNLYGNFGKSIQYGESGDCAYAMYSLKNNDSGEYGELGYSRKYWQFLSIYIHQNNQKHQNYCLYGKSGDLS